MKSALTFLILTLLVTPAMAEPTVDAIVKIATEEWTYFGKATKARSGHKENEEGYYQRVGKYWSDGVGNHELTGKNTDVPWSAAFISYVMRKAGMGSRFAYSPVHSTYIRKAIKARRDQDGKAPFWGYRTSEYAPRVGDMIANSRQDGVDYDRQPDRYKSHCNIVVAVRSGEIDVIGGNLFDSVRMYTLATDSKGLLKTKDKPRFAFCILANRLATK